MSERRRRLLSETASAETELTGAEYSSPDDATIFTVVVISDRDCTLEIDVIDDDGAPHLQHTQAIAAPGDTLVRPGNLGRWRPRLTRSATDAWTAQVYGSAS